MAPALPRLSVVIPSYNQAVFLGRTLESVVGQHYPDLEIIVMDGGSTDDSLAVIDRYRHQIAHVSSGPDGGQSCAIADGFARATGDFVSWLNSDDTYEPGALMAIGTFLRDHAGVDFVYGDTNIIDADDRVIAHKRSIRFNLGVMRYAFLTVPQMSAFWSRRLYEEVGGIDRTLRFCMDYDLFVRMAMRAPPVRIARTIGSFRVHGSSKTSTLEHVRQLEDRLVHDRYCPVKPSAPRAFLLRRRFYQAVMIGLMMANGSIVDRVRSRLTNRFKSQCS
jgi:glycosyltransferase involved in cell wall biosynthesis